MLEKQLQTKFNKYIQNRWTKGTAAFELKITNKTTLPFVAVKVHQIRNLKLAKHKKLVYKIADVGFDQKPFDCFVLVGVPAYVGIMYYKRGERKVYLIDVDDFELEDAKSNFSRSLTEKRASEIAREIIYLEE